MTPSSGIPVPRSDLRVSCLLSSVTQIHAFKMHTVMGKDELVLQMISVDGHRISQFPINITALFFLHLICLSEWQKERELCFASSLSTYLEHNPALKSVAGTQLLEPLLWPPRTCIGRKLQLATRTI